MKRLLLLALLLLAPAARAEAHEEFDWAGLSTKRTSSFFVDLGYRRGDAPGGSTSSHWSVQAAFRGAVLGEDGLTTSGHPMGLEFDAALGSRTGAWLYMDLGLHALVRLGGTEHAGVVAFFGPHTTLSNPGADGGMLRLALSTGLRFALQRGERDLIAELLVQPVEWRDEDPATFSRIDYQLSLLTRTEEGPLFGLRLGVTPMRDRDFYGHQWGLSLVGGY